MFYRGLFLIVSCRFLPPGKQYKYLETIFKSKENSLRSAEFEKMNAELDETMDDDDETMDDERDSASRRDCNRRGDDPFLSNLQERLLQFFK